MQKSSLTLLHVLRRGDLSPSRNERSGLKLDRAMVANVVKLKLSRCVSAVVPHVSKFDILKVRVSVTQICKIDFKFERKKLRRSIL